MKRRGAPSARRRAAATAQASRWWGVGLIVASAGVAAALMAAPLLTDRTPVDADTGRRTDAAAPSHTVVLVDPSQRLEARHKRLLHAAMVRAQRETPRFGQVFVVLIRANTSHEPQWLDSRCSPGDGHDANPLFSNAAMERKRWQEGFADTLAQAADNAGARADRASPISAALRAVALDARFVDSADRRIILVSDMIEYDPAGASLYDRGRIFDPQRDRVAALADVAVRIVWLDRPNTEEVQSGVWARCWTAWFAASGAAVDAGMIPAHTAAAAAR